MGEAKWARSVDARRLLVELQRKALRLPEIADDLRLAICARDQVTQVGSETLVVTASDIFSA